MPRVRSRLSVPQALTAMAAADAVLTRQWDLDGIRLGSSGCSASADNEGGKHVHHHHHHLHRISSSSGDREGHHGLLACLCCHATPTHS